MYQLGRLLFKAIIIFPALVVFVGNGAILRALESDRYRRLERLQRHASRYASFALWIMNVRTRRAVGRAGDGNALIVGNHLSYLDMMVVASLRPTVFVTSVDMGQVPGLGAVCEMAGAIFIERRHRERVAFDLEQIADVLSHGFDITLFPEGTSGDGSGVLPFKKSLLMAAGHAHRPIQPITIKYVKVSGELFSTANRDNVCWYGEMGFVSHLLRVMAQTSIDVEVSYHTSFDLNADSTRDSVALACFEPVAAAYGFPFA